MRNYQVFVIKCTQITPKWPPFSAQEYVNGYAPIAFPPPDIGQFQEHLF
jgi:hypothetical protein